MYVCDCTLHAPQKQDAERREKNLEEAKSIVIKPDPSLPEAKKVNIPVTKTNKQTVISFFF